MKIFRSDIFLLPELPPLPPTAASAATRSTYQVLLQPPGGRGGGHGGPRRHLCNNPGHIHANCPVLERERRLQAQVELLLGFVVVPGGTLQQINPLLCGRCCFASAGAQIGLLVVSPAPPAYVVVPVTSAAAPLPPDGGED
ncbi:hypothetical protein F52700_1506 [Fusarium sp. NRRL 52700]|nr:hypothetical protein F52700_1506 [Fusarium sp. NRRL 52700]